MSNTLQEIKQRQWKIKTNSTHMFQKEKIIYYDDNSTISDMSGVSRKGGNTGQQPKRQEMKNVQGTSKWKTYWSSVRMMLFPCPIALGVLGVLYVIIMLITGNLF